MDTLTRWLSLIAPGWAASRLSAQARLAAAKRHYDAINSSAYRPRRGGGQSADLVMDRARGRLREYARHLDENLDLAVGILDDLVLNIVGNGVGVESMAATKTGKPIPALNADLMGLWAEWWERPEVTHELSGPEVERMACRTWLRDGEVFAQHVIGNPAAKYPTKVPYLLELLESDFVPFDLTTDRITHGIQKDGWGRPVLYHVYRSHPGGTVTSMGTVLETKPIPAERMIHLKMSRRLHQTRGVSIFHAVLSRLDDLKEYEESERIAARVAAAMTAYIKRSGEYDAETAPDGSRAFEMAPGLIFDNLLPGEDVGVIKSDRPNPGLEPFRNGQLRAVAAGTGTRFSSIAKDYNGTYSAQRQELVEGSLAYRRMFSVMRHNFYLPIWRQFIDAARGVDAIRIPKGADERSLYRPEFRPPALPWIDPQKELTAYQIAVEQGFKSRHQVIRDMGGDPATVDAQLYADPLDARQPPEKGQTAPKPDTTQDTTAPATDEAPLEAAA